MSRFEKTIDVRCPVSTVYSQWTQFESFPRFMEGVKDVIEIDDRNVYWHAEIAGVNREGRAQILERIPDRKISWMSVAGSRNGGTVTFAALGTELTRVTLSMVYDASEGAADFLGAIARRIEGDMERFRDFVEEGGTAAAPRHGGVPASTARDH